MYDTASKLYNVYLETYFDEYFDLSNAKSSKMDPKYDPANLTLDEQNHSEWYKEKPDDSTEKGNEEELADLPSLEGDAEKFYSVPSKPLSKGVKERKGLKTSILKKLINQAFYIISTNKVWK